jgi:hypothetical protein
MFNSYEAGRSDFVTLIANYYPAQDPAGGPNFFMMDTNAVYETNIDNNGDAVADITFQPELRNRNSWSDSICWRQSHLSKFNVMNLLRRTSPQGLSAQHLGPSHAFLFRSSGLTVLSFEELPPPGNNAL